MIQQRQPWFFSYSLPHKLKVPQFATLRFSTFFMFADNSHLQETKDERTVLSVTADCTQAIQRLFLPFLPLPCWVWALQSSFSLRLTPGKCYTSIEIIFLGAEKKQAHILQVSGISPALWSHGTLQDPLVWLPAHNSCNEKPDLSTSGKIKLI